MAYKFIEIGDAKIGTIILIEGVACAVKSMDVSTTAINTKAFLFI